MGYYTLPASERTLWGHAALKDALREFMILATWNSANFAEVSSLWIENAANFMLQAVLEAYRCHGASDLDALNECFAWGLTEMDPLAEGVDFEEVVINEMFAGERGEVSQEFEAMKNGMLVDVCLYNPIHRLRPCHLMYSQILPPPGVSLESHLDKLAMQNPWNKFEERMVLGYLTAVLSNQPGPVLAQVRLPPHPLKISF